MTRTTNMAFAFTDEQAMILESAKGFCGDRSNISTVRSLLGSDNGYSQDIWAEMVGLGWTGIAIPEQYGGSELGIVGSVRFEKETGAGLVSQFPNSTAAQSWV